MRQVSPTGPSSIRSLNLLTVNNRSDSGKGNDPAKEGNSHGPSALVAAVHPHERAQHGGQATTTQSRDQASHPLAPCPARSAATRRSLTDASPPAPSAACSAPVPPAACSEQEPPREPIAPEHWNTAGTASDRTAALALAALRPLPAPVRSNALSYRSRSAQTHCWPLSSHSARSARAPHSRWDS
jgi:hypothetical protein